MLAACGQLRLGPVTCAVTDLALRPVSHADLASGPPLDDARLTFRSPTCFTQNGAHLGTLTRFAEFCGTGAQTTHGFGATTLSSRHDQPSPDAD